MQERIREQNRWQNEHLCMNHDDVVVGQIMLHHEQNFFSLKTYQMTRDSHGYIISEVKE